MTQLDIDPKHLENVRCAIEDIRAGRMVILVDDEDRENEGDLCFAASKTTPEAITFMARYGRGLICLTLTEAQVEQLQLPMMQVPERPGPPLGTAFTVSIEARSGVSTGISAADRTRTILVAANPDARPEELVVPGHVHPLKARRGGVLTRAGQTEGSVDLARLAGVGPAGVICEIMNDDGTMARMPDLEQFASLHGLRIVTIADLISYRLQTELLVRHLDTVEMELDQTGTQWRVHVYEATLDKRQVLALVKGQPEADAPTLCRMHAGSILGDLFSSTESEGRRNLSEAIGAIEREGNGVVVYLQPGGNLQAELKSRARPLAPEREQRVAAGDALGSGTPAPQRRSPGGTLREYGLGAQVLRELGLRRIRLLTNNPKKIAGIEGYGLKVVESVPLVSMQARGDEGSPEP